MLRAVVELENAEKAVAEVLNLPVEPLMKTDEVGYIVEREGYWIRGQ